MSTGTFTRVHPCALCQRWEFLNTRMATAFAQYFLYFLGWSHKASPGYCPTGSLILRASVGPEGQWHSCPTPTRAVSLGKAGRGDSPLCKSSLGPSQVCREPSGTGAQVSPRTGGHGYLGRLGEACPCAKPPAGSGEMKSSHNLRPERTQ